MLWKLDAAEKQDLKIALKVLAVIMVVLVPAAVGLTYWHNLRLTAKQSLCEVRGGVYIPVERGHSFCLDRRSFITLEQD